MSKKIKNLPKHIYLQIGEDCDHDDWNDIYPSHEVSWCADKINDNDIVYNLKVGRVQPEVKPVACGQWQKTKPDKPCYFIHRYKRNDNKPDLLDAILDENILCVTNIQDDEFVCTMEEFVDDGEFYIVEYH